MEKKINLEGCKKGGKTTSEKWKKIRQERLEQWIKEEHKCQTCGKIMMVKIRDGKYCSRSCGAAHGRVKQPKHIEGKFECKYCNERFKNKGALANHLYNKHPEYGSKEEQLIKIPGKYNRGKGTLDITLKELEEYKKIHTKCEICGKSLEEIKEKDIQSRGLCIDHDHITNKFRGLLCTGCNRYLGWYDKNQENIIKYLNKNNMLL